MKRISFYENVCIRQSCIRRSFSSLALSLLLAFALPVMRSSATDVKPLSGGWQFIRQDMANAWEVFRPVQSGKPESVPLWTDVVLPHCFNATDAVEPYSNYYQGAGWYRTYIDVDNPYRGGRTLLRFDGAGQKTEVYVYTEKVCSHVGGYDAWTADITDAVARFRETAACRDRFAGKVPVAVRCDNSRDVEMIPSDMSDFNLYGGLYRKVSLVYAPPVRLDNIAVKASANRVDVSADVTGAVSDYDIDVEIFSPAGKRIYKGKGRSNGNTFGISGTKVAKSELWDVDNPRLYTYRLRLYAGDTAVSYTGKFGFRSFEFRKNGPFFLNGKRLLLRGTHRHEDHAGVGAAMTDEMIVREMKQIKDMGANFIRLGHYQQSDLVLQLCDSLGLLVWEEIPWCRGGIGGDAYKSQARRMLAGMISRHRNHPSVILWGLGNENDWRGDFESFSADSIRAFMTELNAIAHGLDDSRMTCIRRCDFAADVVDVYSPTIWAGWYGRTFRDYHDMETAAMSRHERMFHAEWGGDSHARPHAEQPFGAAVEGDWGSVVKGDSKGDWSESYIVRLFDWHLKEQERMPNLTGAAFWTFKDFSTPLRPDNPIPYVNQKGVVERDGTPKESYYVFQSYWARQPMLHIYGHTWQVRWGGEGEAKEVLVYSNCPEVELFVNGVSQGVRKRDSQDFPAAGLHWNVRLNKGENIVRAVAGGLEDEVVWQYQTEKWGRPSALKLSVVENDSTSSTALVIAELVDDRGLRCLDSRDWIEFGFVGDGRLIDNQGTSTGSRRIQAYNGVAMIRVERRGRSVVSASSPGAVTAFADVE